MKIAITASGPTLDSEVDPRFGRCPCFLIVNDTDDTLEVLDNKNAALGSGAGIQSAKMIAEAGAEAILTGNCGPNAYRTLDAAGIAIIPNCSGTVRAAIEDFKKGNLKPTTEPTVTAHFGASPAAAAPRTTAPAAPANEDRPAGHNQGTGQAADGVPTPPVGQGQQTGGMGKRHRRGHRW